MPFSSVVETAETLSTSTSRQDGVQRLRQAESYYQYARRRFGLLGRSLIACHCYFLSGIYLLYSLRPVEAWQSFFEASSLYTVYLKTQTAALMVKDTQSLNDEIIPDEHSCHDELRHCLEQRLYWSCVKSERLVSHE